ncbi:MAG: sulfotransferase domain-containing protein [Bacteroidia bacterium]
MRYYCCGMIRSGSTWQYNIVGELLESRNRGMRSGFTGVGKLAELIDSGDEVIVKMHEALPAATEDVMAGTGKAIYSHRDLRDVAASLMVRNQKRLDWVIENGHLEKAWNNYRKWTSIPGILIQDYELIIMHPHRAITEISQFLHLDVMEEEVKRLALKYSLKNQKEELEKLKGNVVTFNLLRSIRTKVGSLLHSTIGKETTKKITPFFGRVGTEKIHEKTLLHSDHIHKGEIGSWEEVLTPREKEVIAGYLTDLRAVNSPE